MQTLATPQVELRPINANTDTTNVGSIIKLDGLATSNTVLSEEFQKNGGFIKLYPYRLTDNWGRVITGIMVPPLPVTYEMQNKSIAVLHPLAVRANIVIKVLHEVKDGTKKFGSLQKAVQSYYKELADTIFGKTGFFNKNILGPRLKRSFRAVVVPGQYHADILGQSFTWVGIPKRITTTLGIKEGDIVVIGRDPTIWMGSVEFLYAYIVEHNAIELHPLILPQLGGDHDGDQLWGYYPNQDTASKLMVAQFTMDHAVWGKNFNDKQDTNKVDWKQFYHDEKKRCSTTGLSVSPSDVMANSQALDRVFQYCATGTRKRGKIGGVQELLEVANGLSIEEWKSRTEAVNRAQLAMKVFMGPVGLLALRLLVLGDTQPQIRIAAHMLAERCAQGLLDAKHLTYEQVQKFKPARIFEILNLEDKNIKDVGQMLAALQEIVPCDESILPVLTFILMDGRGIAKLSKESFVLFEGITTTATSNPNGYMPKYILDNKYVEEGIFSYAFLKAAND